MGTNRQWRSLTYGGEDHEDEEGAGHLGDAGGERADHAAHLLELAEEPHYAHGAHEAQRGPVGLCDGGQAEEDAGCVDDVPGVAEEAAIPVGEEVDADLDEEGDAEGEIEMLEHNAQAGEGVVAVAEPGVELRGHEVCNEVLCDEEGALGRSQS
jgi:hypothetical protein